MDNLIHAVAYAQPGEILTVALALDGVALTPEYFARQLAPYACYISGDYVLGLATHIVRVLEAAQQGPYTHFSSLRTARAVCWSILERRKITCAVTEALPMPIWEEVVAHMRW